MRHLLVAIGLVLVACVASRTLNAQQAGVTTTAKTPITKWEYVSEFGDARLTTAANTLGAQGWELVSVSRNPRDPDHMAIMYFKRPKQ